MEKNNLKIELYPENKPRYKFDKFPLKEFLLDRKINTEKEKLMYISLDGKKELGYIYANILFGFHRAHTNHLPLIIKPDDIWLLIIQTFTNHVNENSEELRDLLVNFDRKKKLEVKYRINDINDINKEILENFSEQINEKMQKYLGNSLIETLTPNFTTTTKDSEIICKITIMGAFKKFFEYQLAIVGCGIPYIILEGNSDDYKKILLKCEELKKFKFEWYINRIIPIIQKMLEAKEGKIDIDFFKNIVQKKQITENRYAPSGEEPEDMKVKYISGWILKFFGYLSERDDKTGKLKIFNKEKIEIDDFRKLTYQMIKVPIKIIDEVNQKEYQAKYEVGFIGCDKNENNEVFPVEGWIFSILNNKQNKDKREDKKEDKEDEEEDEEEDEDKLNNINDYYLDRIKYPLMFLNENEFENYQKEKEDEEEEFYQEDDKESEEDLGRKSAPPLHRVHLEDDEKEDQKE